MVADVVEDGLGHLWSLYKELGDLVAIDPQISPGRRGTIISELTIFGSVTRGSAPAALTPLIWDAL